MKTKKEQNVETANENFSELTDDELELVSGGRGHASGAGDFQVGDWVKKTSVLVMKDPCYYHVTAINGSIFSADIYSGSCFVKNATLTKANFKKDNKPSWAQD